MSKMMSALLIAAGLGLAGSGMAQTNAPAASPASPASPAAASAPDAYPAPMQKSGVDAAPKGKVSVARDDAAALAKCNLFSGPAKETCITDAKGLQDTPLDKCDGFAGPAKDSCLKNTMPKQGAGK
jgi:hypothetical protein